MSDRPPPKPGDQPPTSPKPREGASNEPGPFTDFGQFGYGMIDKRVLDQDIYWVNIAGQPMFLTAMPSDYQRNVTAYLHDRAAEWWLVEVACVCLEKVLDPDDGAQHIEAAQRLVDLGPEEWMNRTPLMRRLQGLIAARRRSDEG